MDELLLAKTGEHLDYLQEAILRGALEGKTYRKIAEDTYSNEGHVRNVGSELWKILSEGFGEDVTKTNCRAMIKKRKFSALALSGDYHRLIQNFNCCLPTLPHSKKDAQHQPNKTKLHLDLGDAPEVLTFYERTSELATLERWLVQERCRLVALLGITGIGKTALAIRLIDDIKTHFDYIIYRSLRFSPPLNATLANLLQVFAPQAEIPDSVEAQISQLLNYLRQYRCLIVLDDVRVLFSSGQFAGHYKSGCEESHLFFKLVAEVSHQSCLMLLNWEKPREVAHLEKEKSPVRSLVLGSLGAAAKEILKSRKLSDEESWDTLVETYQGNPLWLDLTATLIQELCGGRVSEFLQYEPLILDESLQSQLEQHFQRLAPPEQAVMIQLSRETAPVALPQICQNIPLSPAEVLNAMRSLVRRFLVDAQDQGKTTLFSLNPVFKQSVKNLYLQ
ncbi:NB-ARC domain-containing protein [Kamptonema formosum]|uniref:NB-ARC domain-containing protein n=1 Tax=Kamptonema formosum TaxID=331992 RepID=UPI001E4BDE53|nr:NB-ARC domain-containing protein [Oscillatoria sp. PCC 10802]